MEHWVKHGGGSKVYVCRATSCNKSAEVGAHVQQAGDNRHYISPLCHEHNKMAGEFDVVGPLVSANVADTCGKAPIYR